MYRAALLGRDIGYTKSPAVHKAIADAMNIEIDFEVCDVPYDMLEKAVGGLLSNKDAFFVTKPYKQEIKRFLSATETACGVNFVVCADKRGYNTDGVGFINALDGCFKNWNERVESALVLGAGGAAYAVCEALKKRGKSVYVLNRTLMNAVKLCKTVGAELYRNQSAELIVNATSLGLHGEDALASLCVLPDFEFAFDLVYSPPLTPFLRRCGASGAQTANGADMLVYQAIEGDAIMTGKKFDTDTFERVTAILNAAR